MYQRFSRSLAGRVLKPRVGVPHQQGLATVSFRSSAQWNTFAKIGLVGLGLVAVGSATSHLHAEAPSLPVGEVEATTKEPVSGIKFPLSLSYTGSTSQESLLGLGIRQVTFMYFNVYAAGLYVDSQVRERLVKSARWTQEFSASKLSPGCPEAKWFLGSLLGSTDGAMSMLIQTARTTDAPHMRNGFIKFLTDRLSREVALEAETKTRVLADLDFFRAEFPAGSFKTGQRILATRLPNTGYLQMEFPDRPDAKAFVVENALVGQWFFEGYLTTTRPISPALLQSVSQGLERLVKPQF